MDLFIARSPEPGAGPAERWLKATGAQIHRSLLHSGDACGAVSAQIAPFFINHRKMREGQDMQFRSTDQVRIGARMAALTVAFQAKAKAVDPRSLSHAVHEVDAAFGSDHHLAIDLAAFASCYPELRYMPDALCGAGERLMSSVLRASWPGRTARADIDG